MNQNSQGFIVLNVLRSQNCVTEFLKTKKEREIEFTAEQHTDCGYMALGLAYDVSSSDY